MNKRWVRIGFILAFLYRPDISIGRQPAPYPVYLSNYTFSAGRGQAVLFRVLGDSVQQATLRLAGSNAGLFKLEGNNILLSGQGKKYFKKFSRASFSITFSSGNKTGMEQTFTILKDNFAANKVIAHRGAWKNTGLPQNSIASLQAAIRMGCAGSEFDIQSTADSILVINHDPTYEGMGIEHTVYTDLLKYPLQNGEALPTFEHYLKTGMEQEKTRLIAEIKPSVIDQTHVLELAKRVVEMVHREQAQAWVIYISFDYDALKEVLRLDPAAVTLYLNGDKAPDILKKDGIRGMDYQYRVYHKEEQWIKGALDAGLDLNVWTVDTVPEMEYFLARQVGYITTNEPENLFALLPGSK
ncbi:MAG TPA: glycerophosphodiester phosphodiesterase family protein [Puia sp.]